MPVWKIAPIEQEPAVSLRDWAVYEVDGVYGEGPSRHFVGALTSDDSGRVSSGIQQFDASNLRGVTRSGRVYQLVGRPGIGMDAEYVWNKWCSINNVTSARDVGAELIAQASGAPLAMTPAGTRSTL